jgi:hypothetical protein
MESPYLLAFGNEKLLAALAMTGSEAFFNKLLIEGPQLTRQLCERAEAAGISRHALCRIQQELGVQTARRGGKWWWYGEAHAHLFPLKKMKENSTTITAPLTELCIVDFTAPGGFRILKLPPLT